MAEREPAKTPRNAAARRLCLTELQSLSNFSIIGAPAETQIRNVCSRARSLRLMEPLAFTTSGLYTSIIAKTTSNPFVPRCGVYQGLMRLPPSGAYDAFDVVTSWH